MNWILTGMLLGSLITSTHDTEEACLGRKAMLDKVKEVRGVVCHAQPQYSTNITSGSSTATIPLCSSTQQGYCYLGAK